jgi:hypothetical protein
MKRLIAILGCAALLAAPAAAMAQAAKTADAPKAAKAMTPKAMTANGVVSSVSGTSLAVKGKSGDSTFAVDSKTVVSGKGLGTASKKLAEAGGKPTLTDFVHDGDTVSVTYHEMGGTKTASRIRIISNKM